MAEEVHSVAGQQGKGLLPEEGSINGEGGNEMCSTEVRATEVLF